MPEIMASYQGIVCENNFFLIYFLSGYFKIKTKIPDEKIPAKTRLSNLLLQLYFYQCVQASEVLSLEPKVLPQTWKGLDVKTNSSPTHPRPEVTRRKSSCNLERFESNPLDVKP